MSQTRPARAAAPASDTSTDEAQPKKSEPTVVSRAWTHSWHPGPAIEGLLKLHDLARDEGTVSGLKLAAELLMKAAELKAGIPKRKSARRPQPAASPMDRFAVLAAQSEAETEWMRTYGQKT